MSFLGLHLEPVSKTDPEFLAHSPSFNGYLLRLYKITYKGQTAQVENAKWSGKYYFHGTGHCGCASTRSVEMDSGLIQSDEWCGTPHCATQGILKHGHLLTRSPGGHFFSPYMRTASGYARGKAPNSTEMCIFICRTTNLNNLTSDICSVPTDSDILPCFLAVVRIH